MINSILRMHMFKKLKNLDSYFELLGCKEKYEPKMIKCEICENESFTLACSHTDTGHNILAPVTVQICNKCGFLMQNPRFPDEFYNRYYEEFYPFMKARSQANINKNDPNNIGVDAKTEDKTFQMDNAFLNAQTRARFLLEYINNIKLELPEKSLLDVGCGSGGFIKFFKDNNFHAQGNDPDPESVNYGISKNLEIDLISAEKMNYDRKFGLIIIVGSLEHVYDPNIVLQRCWEHLHENGVLIIEGRYFPISESFRWLNSNHHRFFTNESAQAIFMKHGFNVIRSTTDEVCGANTGRNGAGFAFGIKRKSNPRFLNTSKANVVEEFLKMLKDLNLIISPEEILRKINEHDKNFDIRYVEE